jgi:hypothetical protein
MKLVINKQKVPDFKPDHFLRQAGWAYIFDKRREQESYVKRLTRDFYPRLHLYVKETPEYFTLEVHLDQKQTSYQGVRMHNAEYDGPVVAGALQDLAQKLKEYLG